MGRGDAADHALQEGDAAGRAQIQWMRKGKRPKTGQLKNRLAEMNRSTRQGQIQRRMGQEL